MKFDENTKTELCKIMEECGSDKGAVTRFCRHNYTTLYNYLFESRKNEKLRIFELGLGTNNVDVPSNMGVNGIPGASLKGWKQYFQNSEIFGADIDHRILFQEDRIKTYFCDQTKPHIIQMMWNQKDLENNFDIIIEDGLHEFNANVCFFENSIHKLNKGGFFIIEDITSNSIKLFENKIKEWKLKYSDLEFNLVSLNPSINNYDNNLLVIKKIY